MLSDFLFLIEYLHRKDKLFSDMTQITVRK